MSMCQAHIESSQRSDISQNINKQGDALNILKMCIVNA